MIESANLALSGVAFQTATFQHYAAEYAIDGDNFADISYPNARCAITLSSSWLQVDLLGERLISAVAIMTTFNNRKCSMKHNAFISNRPQR